LGLNLTNNQVLLAVISKRILTLIKGHISGLWHWEKWGKLKRIYTILQSRNIIKKLWEFGTDIIGIVFSFYTNLKKLHLCSKLDNITLHYSRTFYNNNNNNSVTFFKSQLIKQLRKGPKGYQTLKQIQYYDWYKIDSTFDNNLDL